MIPDNIWQKCTDDEKFELALKGLAGQMVWDKDGNFTVLMGSHGFKRLQEFEKQLIKKYEMV